MGISKKKYRYVVNSGVVHPLLSYSLMLLWIWQVHSGFLSAYDSVRIRIISLLKMAIGYMYVLVIHLFAEDGTI